MCKRIKTHKREKSKGNGERTKMLEREQKLETKRKSKRKGRIREKRIRGENERIKDKRIREAERTRRKTGI